MWLQCSVDVALPLEAQGIEWGHQGLAERLFHPGEVEPAQVQGELLDVGSSVVSIAKMI